MVNLISEILAAPVNITKTVIGGVTDVVEGVLDTAERTVGALLAPLGGETTPKEKAPTNQLSEEPA